MRYGRSVVLVGVMSLGLVGTVPWGPSKVVAAGATIHIGGRNDGAPLTYGEIKALENELDFLQNKLELYRTHLTSFRSLEVVNE